MGSKKKTTKTIHRSLVKPKPLQKKVMNFKVTAQEKKAIEAVAERYCKGNVTALVKLAVRSFRPSKRDLVQLR
jgi:hypothetical protein